MISGLVPIDPDVRKFEDDVKSLLEVLSTWL
jgi:hypothetical protein